VSADIIQTTVHDFSAVDSGRHPNGGLLLGNDGNFYGVTTSYTTNATTYFGSVYKFDPSTLNYTTLHVFTGNTGEVQRMWGKLAQVDNYIYGTTYFSGFFGGNGVVFKVDTNGNNYQTLINFNTTTNFGRNPSSGLIAVNNYLYGATYLGGQNNQGALFQIDTNGTLIKALHFGGTNLPGNCVASLTLGRDGYLYGTSLFGTNGYGAAFQVTTNLTDLRVIANFPVAAQGPRSPLTEGPNDGEFFGTSSYQISWPNYVGTVYKVSSNGVTVMLSFTNGANNIGPDEALTLGPDGAMYGVFTYKNNGTFTNGIVYRLFTNGTYATIYDYTGSGSQDPSTITFGTDGNLYHTMRSGSTTAGIMSRLSVPMIPIIDNIVVNSTNTDTVNVTFQSVAGQSYLVQSNANLSTPNKGIMYNNVLATDGLTTLYGIPKFDPTTGFFQIGVENVPTNYAVALKDYYIPQLNSVISYDYCTNCPPATNGPPPLP